MSSSGEPRASARLAVLLAGTALLALAAAAGPASGVPSPHPPAPPALTGTGTVADLVVSVSVTPNRPGPNAFTVQVTSSRRPPPAPVTAVRLSVAGRTVPLAAVAAGQYAGGGRLDRPGPTRAAVVIVRSGRRMDVRIGWSVGSAPAVDATPAAPSGPPSGGLGLLWAVLLPPLLGAVVLIAGRRRRSGRPDPTAAAAGDGDARAGAGAEAPLEVAS